MRRGTPSAHENGREALPGRAGAPGPPAAAREGAHSGMRRPKTRPPADGQAAALTELRRMHRPPCAAEVEWPEGGRQARPPRWGEGVLATSALKQQDAAAMQARSAATCSARPCQMKIGRQERGGGGGSLWGTGREHVRVGAAPLPSPRSVPGVRADPPACPPAPFRGQRPRHSHACPSPMPRSGQTPPLAPKSHVSTPPPLPPPPSPPSPCLAWKSMGRTLKHVKAGNRPPTTLLDDGRRKRADLTGWARPFAEEAGEGA